MSSENQKPEKKSGFGRTILLYVHDLAYLVAIMMVIFLLLFRVVVVSGSSMEKTLYDGDYLLLLSNVFYTEPKSGDVIVASKDSFENGVPIVKRVIAVEGQTVDIDFETQTVYVDGKALNESDYVYFDERFSSNQGKTSDLVFPLVVDEGCVFVMGDNRYVSRDSRDSKIGLLDKREILGKAIFLFLPGTDGGTVERDFSRIGGLH